jgi:hypothetical protein
MLGKVFDRFVEKSPISVMVRGTLERVLGADQLDAWFARTAQKQYTRTVLFSTVYDVLSQVVFRIKPSVRAGDCLPAPGSVFPFGNQYVGLSQGRLVRLVPGPGRLQHVGGGDSGVA